MKRRFLVIKPFWVAILALLTTLSACNRDRIYTVKTKSIRVVSSSQIVPLTDSYVKPFLYTNISGLADLPVPKAKFKFISAVLPAILVAKNEMETRRIRIKTLREKEEWNKEDSIYYVDLSIRYKAKDIDDLLIRMGTLPNSIVLAQAAVESGWGQSRLFRKGNNLFGVWSFNPNEPRLPAGRARNNKTIYLRKYKNMSQSIVHYFEILSSANAYKSLRKARLQQSDPFELLPHLKNFSERKRSYTNQLRTVIVQNRLTQYDTYLIDPDYLEESD